MLTLIKKPTAEVLSNAAELLRQGQPVAIPTETVYGLAASAYDIDACRRVFEIKGRPQDNPLIVHISDLNMLYGFTKEVPPLALTLAERFWSGPLTMIFKRKDIIPAGVCGGLDTVAVRMPDCDPVRQLIRLCGFPLAAPSANLSGSPSPTTARHVYDDLNGKIPLIIDGGECRAGVESTVICFTGEKGVRILRPGAVTAEMLGEYAEVEWDENVFKQPEKDARVISPGMKYKHYSPKAEIIIVKAQSVQALAEYLNARRGEGVYAVLYGDEEGIDLPRIDYGVTPTERAHNLFAALRKTDELGARTAYVRCPETDGIGAAVYNRLLRAAAFRVVEL